MIKYSIIITDSALLIDGLHRGDVAQIAQAMTDKLHQPYRESLIKGMKTISQKAAEAGALATVISCYRGVLQKSLRY